MTEQITAAAPRRIHNPLQQETATFLETAEETGGARTLLEIDVAPGGGVRIHRHATYAERFTVREGVLTVQVGDRVTKLHPGDEAVAPAGTMHRFVNESSERAIFRVEVTPGHRGFENAFQVAYGLARDGLVRPDGVPKSLTHAALLAVWSESDVGGLLGLVTRMMTPLAWLARRRGIDAELVERYRVT